MSNLFTLTLILLFASALFGAFLRSRARDRCLKDFEGYQVDIQENPEKRAWGRLIVYPNGVELIYASAQRDTQGHLESSVIYYADQLQQVRFIMRAHDRLSVANQKRPSTWISCRDPCFSSGSAGSSWKWTFRCRCGWSWSSASG